MKVRHDPHRRLFVGDLKPYQACLLYARRGKALDFYHIYVPAPYRNQGLAAKILIAAFNYAKKQGYRVIPTCPFIRNDFLPRFSKYQPLVIPGKPGFVFWKGRSLK